MFRLCGFGVHSFESVPIGQLLTKALKIRATISLLVFAFIFMYFQGREPQITLGGKKKKSLVN